MRIEAITIIEMINQRGKVTFGNSKKAITKKKMISATLSRTAPVLVTILNFLATIPSRRSDNPARE